MGDYGYFLDVYTGLLKQVEEKKDILIDLALSGQSTEACQNDLYDLEAQTISLNTEIFVDDKGVERNFFQVLKFYRSVQGFIKKDRDHAYTLLVCVTGIPDPSSHLEPIKEQIRTHKDVLASVLKMKRVVK